MNNVTDSQQNLKILLKLQERARSAESIEELAFIIVNETKLLTPFRQGIIWNIRRGVRALSGVSVVDHNTPFVQWVHKLASVLIKNSSKPVLISSENLSTKDASDWEEWLPSCGVAVPFMNIKGKNHSLLILARETPWSLEDTQLLSYIADAYGYSWNQLEPPSMAFLLIGWRKKILGLILFFLMSMLLAYPIPLTILAPAEIVPIKPAVIRAPLQGIIDKILVQPNQIVKKGTLLFTLDKTDLQNRLNITRKSLETAKTKYQQATQQALSNQKAKERLPHLVGQIKEKEAQILFTKAHIKRMNIKAPQAGIVILDNQADWVGRPVMIGERILLIANPNDVEIEAWVEISDAIDFPNRSIVRVFLNSNPLNALDARLKYLAYEASLRPEGSLAHRVRAALTADSKIPRIGQRGTARIHGKEVSIFFWILRRPFSLIRTTFGL